MGQYTVERYSDAPETVRPALEARRVNRAHFGTNHHGYEEWSAAYNGEKESVLVHRLLAVAKFGFGAVCGNVVHHGPEAEIPWANWYENIQLMGRDDHMTHHHHADAPTWGERVGMFERYCESDISQPEVAEEFGVSKWVVQRSIARVADERGEQPPNEHLRKEQLSWEDRVEMYKSYQRNDDLTHADIAERYGIDASNVSRSIQKVREEREGESEVGR